ncbi:GNAT family N-acetyltransferase [Pseudonocardia sp. TRM90224]|uniref:GNAT family N-acetyltransferase n=1 Tax=Pseudonocardia sp. TRM90224 TaxID=2812678 RepID=UPI001E5D0385|nr:GNAT family N-acetyltransferase [Pseudonocardia sp. TRM90224]
MTYRKPVAERLSSGILIRAARQEEAAELRELAIRSKSYWPYPADFLRRWARLMSLTPEVIASNDVRVAERGGVVVGFSTVLRRGAVAVLDDLWLEPDEIGSGTGRLLFEDAVEGAAAAGARLLEWEAEPYAVPFYERMGGIHTGYADSPLGRPLPTMHLPL